MRFLWRWIIRLLVVIVIGVIGLLLPVAYTETMCRPQQSSEPYAAILEAEHHRAETRTLMTYPEWHIVHAYDDYAEVIRTGDPHEYRFISGIGGFWQSLCSLSRASGALGEVDYETKQMVYVIGVSFTAELLLKAAYEETIGRIVTLMRGAKRATLDDLSAKQAAAYAKFLQQVPWYKWNFSGDAAALAASNAEGLRNAERRFALGVEYAAKASYAAVIARAVSQVGPDDLTLRMIVRGASPDQLAEFEGVTVIGERESGVEIETIRYRSLTHLIQSMAASGVEFVEIAGNDDIMLTAISDQKSDARSLFSAQRQGYNDHRHLLAVKVPELASVVKALAEDGLLLEHIHDY